VLVFIVGILALILVRVLVDLLPPESGREPYLGAWLRLWVFAIFMMCALVIYRVKDQELMGQLLALFLGLFFAGLVMLTLRDTSFSFNGVSGDQGLLTAQVTKFASYPGPVDFAYKDLPPFYPPLALFVLGKIAAIFGIEPYRMLKYGLIAMVFVIPFLTLRFWSWMRPAALSLAAIFSLLLFQEWYKPFEWLALALFVPWWLHFVDGVGAKKGSRHLGWIAVGSLLGAALFSTYYYWFFIGGLSLLIRFFLRNTPEADGKEKEGVSRISGPLVLTGAAIFSAPYWVPLLVSMWRTGGWVSLQNRYFLDEFNTLPFPFLEFSIPGVLMLAGLVYLVQSFRRNSVSFGLLVLLLAAYAWQILGYAALLLQSPLLTFKARDFVVYVLGLSAALGAVELIARLGRNSQLRKESGRLLFAGLVVLGLFYGQVIVSRVTDRTLLAPALKAGYPQELISIYKEAVSDQTLDRVVLADRGLADLSIYLPVFQFLPWAAVYSHPAGQYYERLDFLQRLSEAESPAWFAAALMNNRYDHIDEIILFPRDGDYVLGYLPDNFPNPSDAEQIVFPHELLDPAYFSQAELTEFIVFIPDYAADPFAELPDPQGYDVNVPIGDFGDGDDLFEFLERFQGHLSFPGQAEYWSRLSAEFGP